MCACGAPEEVFTDVKGSIQPRMDPLTGKLKTRGEENNNNKKKI